MNASQNPPRPQLPPLHARRRESLARRRPPRFSPRHLARRPGRGHVELDRSDDGQADELRKKGKACILLWMPGGPSQFETFSPKPGHPNGGATKAISTAVSGIQIAENLSAAGQVDERPRDHPLDDQQGRKPSARHVPHAHRLYPERQRQVSQLRRRRGPRDRRSEKRFAVVRPRRRPRADRRQRRLPRRAIRSVRHPESGRHADQHDPDHQRRSLSPPARPARPSSNKISRKRRRKKSSIIRSNTRAPPR